MKKTPQWFESKINMQSDWEYDYIFDQPRPGLKIQKFITIEVKDNKLVQRTVRRTFYGETDYQDSTTTEVLMSFEDFDNG